VCSCNRGSGTGTISRKRLAGSACLDCSNHPLNASARRILVNPTQHNFSICGSIDSVIFGQALSLVILTVIPAVERPVAGFRPSLEHFLAFGVAGLIFGLAYPQHLRVNLFSAVAFALALEVAQIPLPTRHPRLKDFIIDASAACLGIVIAFAVTIAAEQFAGSLLEFASLTSVTHESRHDIPLILAYVFAEQYRVIAVSLCHYFPEPWDGRGDDFSILQHAVDLAEGSTKCSAPAPARNCGIRSTFPSSSACWSASS